MSSFIACVLCGAFADVDLGDACGMNLLDVRKGAWSRECLFACVQGNEDDYEALLKKLGTPVPCDTVVVSGALEIKTFVKQGLIWLLSTLVVFASLFPNISNIVELGCLVTMFSK